MASDSEQTLDLFCPDCNVQVEARVVARETEAEPIRPVAYDDLVDTPHNVTTYSFARCKRCGFPFLVQEDSYEVFGEFAALQSDRVLYPTDRAFDQEGLPATVARAYRDATRSFTVGLYAPCVIMCRKALEGIAKELGASKGTLKKRLDELQALGKIDTRLLEWAHGLRLVGNDAAHEFGIQLDKQDAQDSLEFLEALLLYVFTLTRRFEAFKARRTATGEDG